MAVAPVVPLQEEGVRLRDVLQELNERGVVSPREKAQAVLAEHGPEWFLTLTREDQEYVLTTAIGRLDVRTRRSGIRGDRVTVTRDDGTSESVMRIAATGRAYLSARWHVVGGKTTAELDKKDVERLAAYYRTEAFEMIARAKWFDAVLDMLRNYRAKTVGDLVARGVDLPTLDVPEED